MLNIKAVTLSLSVFLAVSFVICVIYGLIVSDAFHMHSFLENVLPGFHWLTVGSFFIGLIESFLWGTYIGLVFGWINNFFHKKLAAK